MTRRSEKYKFIRPSYEYSALWFCHLQEASPSKWLFARGWSLRVIICKRPVDPDNCLQGAGPSRWPFERGRLIVCISWCCCCLSVVVVCLLLSFVCCCYLFVVVVCLWFCLFVVDVGLLFVSSCCLFVVIVRLSLFSVFHCYWPRRRRRRRRRGKIPGIGLTNMTACRKNYTFRSEFERRARWSKKVENECDSGIEMHDDGETG